MKLTEIADGTGLYKIPKEDLSDDQQFIRADDVNGEVQPLLHICVLEDMTRETGEYYACKAGRVIWRNCHGHYECFECNETFKTDKDMCEIWADGKGTGYEGTA